MENIQNILQQQSILSSSERAAIANDKGAVFQGENVLLRPVGDSMYRAAAEEMTFAGSRFVSKDMAKRSVRDHSRNARLEKMVRDYLSRVPDVERRDRLDTYLNRLLGKPQLTLSDFRKSLNSSFGDVTHKYIALQYAQQHLMKRMRLKRRLRKGGGLLGMVSDELASLEASENSAIAAGLNVSAVAQTFSQKTGVGSVDSLRTCYRRVVLEYGGLMDAYRDILECFGMMHFSYAVEYLVQGLAADIAEKGPSISRAELKQIMTDMYKLRIVNTLYESAQITMTRLD